MTTLETLVHQLNEELRSSGVTIPGSSAEAFYLARKSLGLKKNRRAGLQTLALASFCFQCNSLDLANIYFRQAEEFLRAATKGKAKTKSHLLNLLHSYNKGVSETQLETFARCPFTKDEAKLISYLQSGPKDKFDLISHIYGSDSGFKQNENRLKNLLFRLKKKNSTIIVLDHGRYRTTLRESFPPPCSLL